MWVEGAEIHTNERRNVRHLIRFRIVYMSVGFMCEGSGIVIWVLHLVILRQALNDRLSGADRFDKTTLTRGANRMGYLNCKDESCRQ